MSKKIQPKIQQKMQHVSLEEIFGPAIYLHVGICLLKTGLIFRAIFTEALKDTGVISSQFGLLAVLHEHGRASQIDLGHLMGIDKATMVKLVDGLEDLKYVRRMACSVDRRVKFIEMTPAGIAAHKKMNKIHSRVEKKFFEVLTEKEKKTLAEITTKLIRQKVSGPL